MSKPVLVRLLLTLLIVINPFIPLWEMTEHVAAQQPLHNNLIDFSSLLPPQTAEEARDTFAQRANLVIDYTACKMEDYFAERAGDDYGNHRPEDVTYVLLAKIYRYYQLIGEDEGIVAGQDTECRQTRIYDQAGLNGALEEFRKHGILVNEPGSCPEVTTTRNRASNQTEVTFLISVPCLKTQINTALMNLRVTGQVGSSIQVCPWTLSETKGEYDFTLRNLIRVLYMRPVHTRGTSLDVLETITYDHLVIELLTLEGGPAADSYSIYDCGNAERSSGTPEQRADRLDFGHDVLNALGGTSQYLTSRWAGFSFLRWLAYLFTAAFGIYSVLVLIAGAVIGVLAADDLDVLALPLAAVPGLDLLPAFRVPESENHRLMIESSRYLTNQLLLQELNASGTEVPNDLNNLRNGTRTWLLERLQQLLEEDFDEYNSRPYQHYSITAITNLYDYADDPQLHQAASMVLDYLSAKFALDSNRGRRVVPFRRRAECTDETNLQDEVYPEELFRPGFGCADYLLFSFLIHAGQTQLLPNQSIDRLTAGEMIYSAVSGYRVPTDILDLAIHKGAPYFQRIHHDGVEIYWSAPSFLITAGGMLTGPANTVVGVGLPADAGSAVPTTLMPTVAGVVRSDFIRFEGGDRHERSTCVAPGFACGLNPVIPNLYQDINCLSTSEPNWVFINSARCVLQPERPPPSEPAPANDGPYFYVAMYCPGGDSHCRGATFGLLEAVDAPNAVTEAGIVDYDAFEQFKQSVLYLNPASTLPPFSFATGVYSTQTGHLVEFTPAAAEEDEWAILSFDNVVMQDDMNAWPLAEGDILNSRGDGVVTIFNPNRGSTIVLDLSSILSPITIPAVIPR